MQRALFRYTRVALFLSLSSTSFTGSAWNCEESRAYPLSWVMANYSDLFGQQSGVECATSALRHRMKMAIASLFVGVKSLVATMKELLR